MAHNVVLVDDHHLVRSGLVAMVNALGAYQVAMEAGNGRELIDVLGRVRENGGALPTIAIVDLNMPVMDGYETLSWLREHHPKVLSLALTFDATDEARLRAVRAGARGFLLKNARPEVLRNALDSLLLSGYYYTEDTHVLLKDNPDMRTREERDHDRLLALISPRELEFLLLVCNEAEFTYEQIADKMAVHRRTVDNFRISLFEKFNIKSKTGLVLFAMRWGLLNGK